MNKTTRLKKPQIPELDTLYEFDDLGGRPKYGGVEMTSETDIPSFQEIMDETHSAVVAEATARDDADDALEAEIQELAGQTSEALENEATTRAAADTALQGAINSEASTRGTADNALQNQIDAIVASSDVKDIVGTKAELDAYDTSTLGDNDIIKVLQDETQSNATTYYRYAEATDSFTLIGAEGPYYTKSATDTLLNAKADKATTYTKTEADTLLNAKADKATTYTKTEVDTALNAKADKATTYTKTEVNTAVNGVDTKIGNLTNLSTTDKSNLVAAINEVAEMENSTFFYYSLGTNDITLYTDIAKTIPVSAEMLRDAYLRGPVYLIDDFSGGGSVPEFMASPITYFWYGQGSSGVYFTIVSEDQTFWRCYGYEGDTSFACRSYSVLNDNNIRQTTGTSTTNVMSQKAVTDALAGSGGPTVVQTTGTSTASVMSQNATSSMVHADPATRYKVKIGSGATANGADSVAVGHSASANSSEGVAVGKQASASAQNSVAIGAYSWATTKGQFEIGTTTSNSGYNNSRYRLLTGLYDPQSDHDAATKGYVDTAIASTDVPDEFTYAEWNNLWA